MALKRALSDHERRVRVLHVCTSKRLAISCNLTHLLRIADSCEAASVGHPVLIAEHLQAVRQGCPFKQL